MWFEEKVNYCTLYWSMMFYVHAQMVVFSEHSQDVLLFCVHAYWVGASEHAY